MNRKLFVGVAAIGLLAVAMIWLAFNRGPLAPVKVQIAAVKQSELSPSVFGIGTVEARYSYAIGPTQAGRVLRVLVDHGDSVRAGQLLAEMEPVDLEQRLYSASALQQRQQQSVLVADAQLREAQSRHQVASANATRYRALAQKNFVSQEAVEVRNNEASVTQAGIEAAQAAMHVARKDVERSAQDRNAAAKQLANLRLIAPVDGLVVVREAEPGSTVVAGQAVVRLIDPNSVWVRARINQSLASGLATGLRAGVVLRSNQSHVIAGTVARVEIQSDAVTEERVVTISFTAPPRMSLGELAEVTIHQEKRAPGLAVPSAAVKRVGNQQGVWQIEDGKTRFRAVKTGVQTLDGMTEVIEGLAAGDSVIVYSSAQLREGIKVVIGKTS
ncbi:MAG: efflux RND transporter periplasmic adaptor subunit [Burkholderiales bacterium]